MTFKQHRLVTLVSWGLFIILGLGVTFRFPLMTGFDQLIFTSLSHMVSQGVTSFAKVMTAVGSPLVLTILTLLLILLTQFKHLGRLIEIFAFYFGTSALGLVLKYLFQRQRPSHQLLADTGFSFPSGHSLCAALLFFTVYSITSKLPKASHVTIRILVGIFSLLVMLSRIYLRDHFPTDILGSILLSLGAYGIYQSYRSKEK